MWQLKMENEISNIISENDKMLYNESEEARKHYFSVSSSAIECIFNALNITKKTTINSILDLPSGHGRVLRSLISYFPSAQITSCDLEKDAVDFCVNTFSVEGVYSSEDVTKISLNRKYDLIWCGSLLTHFKEKDARKFFKFFLDHLEEDGLLLVTLHGRNNAIKAFEKDSSIIRKIAKRYFNVKGYLFAPSAYVIDKSYTIPNYGGALVNMSWVSSLIHKNEDIRIVYYSEKLWDNNQDVLAIQKKSIRG